MGIVREIDNDILRASAISTAELQAVASALFSPENLNLVVVGSWNEQEKLGALGQIEKYAVNWAAACSKAES